jgi:hypothetical protein
MNFEAPFGKLGIQNKFRAPLIPDFFSDYFAGALNQGVESEHESAIESHGEYSHVTKAKPPNLPAAQPVLLEKVQRHILLVRGKKVMLDRHLAQLYGVSTSNLNKAVSRNIERFPSDFMFQLNQTEFENLKFHFGTSSWGGTRKRPRAFTEQGVAMLSSVLRSRRAVMVNIAIMRAFVQLRQMLKPHKELARKLDEMERKYDARFRVVFDAIRQLMEPPEPPRERIGFRGGNKA